jgi:hypothetical protein
MIPFLKAKTIADVLEGKARFVVEGPVCLDSELNVHDASLLLAERAISSGGCA